MAQDLLQGCVRVVDTNRQIDPDFRHEIVRRQPRTRDIVEALREGPDLRRIDRHSGGGAVSAVAYQQVAARRQPRVKIEGADGPPRAFPDPILDRDQPRTTDLFYKMVTDEGRSVGEMFNE